MTTHRKEWLSRGAAVFLLAAAAGAPLDGARAADPAQNLFVEAMNLTGKARAEADAAKRVEMLSKAQADLQRIVSEHGDTKLGKLLAEGKKIGAFDPKDVERLLTEARAAAGPAAPAAPAEPKAEAKAEAKPEPKAAPKVDAKPEPKAEPKAAAPVDAPLAPPSKAAASEAVQRFTAGLPPKENERYRAVRAGIEQLPLKLSFADATELLSGFQNDARFDLLVLIAPHLPERGLSASEIAALLDRLQGHQRVRVIRDLSGKLAPLPAAQHVPAVEAILGTLKADERVTAAVALAPVLGGELQPRTVALLLQGNEDHRRRNGLHAIAPVLAPTLTSADLGLLLSDTQADARLDIVALLAPRLAERGLPMNDAVALLARLQGHQRLRAVKELATKLAPIPPAQHVAAADALLAGTAADERAQAATLLLPAMGNDLPVQSVTALLQGIEGYRRQPALRSIVPVMAPVPAAERTAAAQALLGTLQESAREMAVHDLLPVMGKDLNVETATALLGTLQGNYRRQAIKALASQMKPVPPAARAEAARTLLGGVQDYERADSLATLAPLFGPDLSIAEAAALLGSLQGQHRAQGVQALAPQLIDNVKMADLPTLLGNLTEHSRLVALAALAERLDPQLKPSDLALFLQPFNDDGRASLIKTIAARRSGMSAVDFLAIGGLPRDEYQRRRAYVDLMPSLPKPLGAPEATTILAGVHVDHVPVLTPLVLAALSPDLTVEERAALLASYRGRDAAGFAAAVPEPDLGQGKPPAAGSFAPGDCATVLSWAMAGSEAGLTLGGKGGIPKGLLNEPAAAAFGVPATTWTDAQITGAEDRLRSCAAGMAGTRKTQELSQRIAAMTPLRPYILSLRDIPAKRAALAAELKRLKELPPTIAAMGELRDGGGTAAMLADLPVEDAPPTAAELDQTRAAHAERVAAAVKEQLPQVPETLDGLDRIHALAGEIRSTAGALWSNPALSVEKAFDERRAAIAIKALGEFRTALDAVPTDASGFKGLETLAARPGVASLPDAAAAPYREALAQRRAVVAEAAIAAEIAGVAKGTRGLQALDEVENTLPAAKLPQDAVARLKDAVSRRKADLLQGVEADLTAEIAAVGKGPPGLIALERIAEGLPTSRLPKDAAARLSDALTRRKAEVVKELQTEILKKLAELPESPEGYGHAMELAESQSVLGIDAPTLAALRKAGKERADAILDRMEASYRAKLAQIPDSDEGVEQAATLRTDLTGDMPVDVAQRFTAATNDRIAAIRAKQRQVQCDEAVRMAGLKDAAAVTLAAGDGTRTLKDLTCALASDPAVSVRVAGYEAPGLFGRTHTLTLSGKPAAKISLKELEKGKGLVGIAVEAGGKSVEIQPAAWQSLMDDWRRLHRLTDPNGDEAVRADMAAGIEDGRQVCAATGFSHPQGRWPLSVATGGAWAGNHETLEALQAAGLIRLAGVEHRGSGFSSQEVSNYELTPEGRKSWNAARAAFCFGRVRAVVVNYTLPAARDGMQASMVTARLYPQNLPGWVADSPVAGILDISTDAREPTEVSQVLLQTAKGWVDAQRLTTGVSKSKLGK